MSPKREEEEEGMDNAARLAEIDAELPESNEDDTSSTTTDPGSNDISPNSRIKRITTNWQKGELLGRGSLGPVYEGISEYVFQSSLFFIFPFPFLLSFNIYYGFTFLL